MLEALSHQRTLRRGFAYVTTEDGTVISSVRCVPETVSMQLHFSDGHVSIRKTPATVPHNRKKPSSTPLINSKQQSLF
jgi:exonuclease VII large subunit